MTQTPSIDDLLSELNRLRLDREEAARDYRERQERSNRREGELIAAIQRRRRRNPAAESNLRNNRANRLKVGERMRITNHLRSEYGVVGTIITVGHRMVTIEDDDGNEYSRAWWNLERHTEPRNAQ